jgi:hypothetical protein
MEEEAKDKSKNGDYIVTYENVYSYNNYSKVVYSLFFILFIILVLSLINRYYKKKV